MLTHMVSTSDNPYNPFTEPDEWDAFDRQRGYNTWNYLTRLAPEAPSLEQDEYDKILQEAIDEVLRFNLTGNYIRVENPAKHSSNIA